MTNKPPFNGEWVKLGDICTVITGNTPSTKNSEYYSNKDIPFVKPGDITGSTPIILDKSENYISESAREKARIAPSNCVLMTCIGIIGKVGITASEAAFNQQINAAIPNGKIDTRYLAYQLSYKSNSISKNANQAVVPILNKSTFANIDIYLPSLDAQLNIVKILDSITRLIDIHSFEKIKLDQLIKSRFVEMFCGGQWLEKTIGDLAADIRYGTSKKASDSGKYKYLRMNNLTDNGALIFENMKFIDLDGTELENCKVIKGDLLFNRTNSREKVGKTAVFLEDEPMVIAGYIIRVRMGDEMYSEYLSAYLNLPSTKEILRSIAKGAVHQANINSKELAAVKVPVPPKEDQQRFVNFMHEVDKSQFVVQQQIDKLQTLYDSLAQEYFG